MAKAQRMDRDVIESLVVDLKALAETEASELGHTLSRWSETANGTWNARCGNCLRTACIIPSRFPYDNRGRGGKVLSEICIVEVNGNEQ